MSDSLPDAVNVPASAPPAVPAPAPAAKRGWAGPVMGGVIAAGIGFGAAVYILPQTGLIAAASPADSAAISALQADIAALKSAPAPALDAGIADRLTAIESRLDGLPVVDVAALDARLAALESRPVGSLSGADAAALADLQTKVAALSEKGLAAAEVEAAKSALKAELDAAIAQTAALQDAAETRARTAGQTAARMQLAAAVESGAPFANLLPAFDPALPDALVAQAQSGVPSLPQLRDAFPAAARTALDSALRADLGATWGERTVNFLKTQVGARSLTAKDGDDPDAVLSRAEALLAAGDLTAALADLDHLPETAKGALADWRAKADARAAALAALADLQGAP